MTVCHSSKLFTKTCIVTSPSSFFVRWLPLPVSLPLCVLVCCLLPLCFGLLLCLLVLFCLVFLVWSSLFFVFNFCLFFCFLCFFVLPALTDCRWWFESLLVHSGVSSATRRKATGADQKKNGLPCFFVCFVVGLVAVRLPAYQGD